MNVSNLIVSLRRLGPDFDSSNKDVLERSSLGIASHSSKKVIKVFFGLHVVPDVPLSVLGVSSDTVALVAMFPHECKW